MITLLKPVTDPAGKVAYLQGARNDDSRRVYRLPLPDARIMPKKDLLTVIVSTTDPEASDLLTW